MNYIILKQELQKFWDLDSNNYVGMPNNAENSAKQWRSAFETYYLTMTVPLIGRSNPLLKSGLSTFEKNLLISIKNQTIKNDLANLIEELHYNIIEGVDIFNIYKTIYPSYKLSLDYSFSTSKKASTICEDFAIKIDAWIRTTYSVQINSGITFPWF